ncbi:glycosyl hydrolase [Anaerocellum danielii]|uniref:Glycosyl hydrolase n=1 Tax=Anaerocellum danielii TaxID=1387557 RepID=A0ABZ0TXZ1_9FIRM|nr:glycosyl hydrolase [Caldicellulosiruptor danielii]WPX08333.1 glycosyl hydrolase [Caldicellulosiruptor danielii]
MNKSIKLSSLFEKINNTPTDASIIHWWIFSDEMTENRINAELDYISSLGLKQVLIAAGHNVSPKYLTNGWFEMVKFAVFQAKKRGIKVWIADEGSYPSGFAGETFNNKYPHKRMKAIVVEKEFFIEGNLCKVEPHSGTIGILAKDINQNKYFTFEKLEFSTGFLYLPYHSTWQIKVISSAYRTSPTRYVHHPTGAKDTTYSLCDYLDYEAVNLFINEVYEKYKAYIGEEFGKTIIGFFADEPDYSISGLPYTDNIFDIFYNEKGYDVKKYIPDFFKEQLDEEIKRVKADYWDVWSNIFTNTFFKQIYNWCETNGLKFVVHLNHEDMMDQLIKSEGQFFSHMKYVHIPAIDVIWRQIWYDKKAVFPKYASSVSHIKNIPQTFSESFAVYGQGISVEQIKWVVDYQFAMDINLFLTSIFRYLHNHPQSYFFPEVIKYINTVSYLLYVSTPCTKVLVYFPTPDLWASESVSALKAIEIGNALLGSQIDFDFFDHSLLEYLEIKNHRIYVNSKKEYNIVVLPPIKYLPQEMFRFLKLFSRNGGKIFFFEDFPLFVYNKTFTSLFYFTEKELGVVVNNIEQLSKMVEKDIIVVDSNDIKILHKRIEDNHLIFLFNDSSNPFLGKIILNFSKKNVYIWDQTHNKFLIVSNVKNNGKNIQLELYMHPYQTLVLIASDEYVDSVQKTDLLKSLPRAILELNHDWEIHFGKDFVLHSDLKDWQSLGFGDYSGNVVYRKTFVFSHDSSFKNKRLFLYCPNVKYSAKVWLNQKYLGARAFSPFMWDITEAIKTGRNELVIEVQNTLAAGLLGTQEKLEKLRKEAEKNFYLSISLKFDLEMVQSGLLPPVAIVSFE